MRSFRILRSAIKHAFSDVFGRRKAVRESVTGALDGKGCRKLSRASAFNNVLVSGASVLLKGGGENTLRAVCSEAGTIDSQMCVGIGKFPRCPRPLFATVHGMSLSRSSG